MLKSVFFFTYAVFQCPCFPARTYIGDIQLLPSSTAKAWYSLKFVAKTTKKKVFKKQPYYNSQNVETTQIFINWWMGKQNAIHLYNLTTRRSEILKCHSMDKPWKYYTTWKESDTKPTYYMAALIWNSPNEQENWDRNRWVVARGWVWSGGGADWHRISFGGNEDVLELDRGDGCTTLRTYLQPLKCLL